MSGPAAWNVAVQLRTLSGLIAIGVYGVAGVAAQSSEAGQAGPRDILPRDHEIALARSAAPANVVEDATVLVLTEAGYEVAIEGQSGVTCYVGRSWPKSLEPHCFDAEGSRTILPIHLRMEDLRRAGRTPDQIDAVVEAGLADGTFQLPTRPAMSYMMSGGQVLYNDEGEHVGRWQPHLMIYYPNLEAEAMGLFGAPSTDAAIVVDSGEPLSNIMIVVRSFVDPDSEARTTPGGGG